MEPIVLEGRLLAVAGTERCYLIGECRDEDELAVVLLMAWYLRAVDDPAIQPYDRRHRAEQWARNLVARR